MLYFRNRTLVALALLSINACGSSTESPQLSSAFASRATPLVSAQHVNPFGQLYVADALSGNVTMYARGRSKLTKTLGTGDGDPVSVAASADGTVYVAARPYSYSSGDVAVYSKNGKQVRFITDKIEAPTSVALDSHGNLYVANNGGNDPRVANDDLFVLNAGNVTEYAYGQTEPERTLEASGSTPVSLAVDASGNAYIGNDNPSDVRVFSAGTTSASETITAGVNDPEALLVDLEGTLYVANYSGNDVTIYPTGTTAPSATISQNIDAPGSLILDGKQNLYVGNIAYYQTYSITVYAHDDHALIRTITAGVNYPDSMAFGP